MVGTASSRAGAGNNRPPYHTPGAVTWPSPPPRMRGRSCAREEHALVPELIEEFGGSGKVAPGLACSWRDREAESLVQHDGHLPRVGEAEVLLARDLLPFLLQLLELHHEELLQPPALAHVHHHTIQLHLRQHCRLGAPTSTKQQPTARNITKESHLNTFHGGRTVQLEYRSPVTPTQGPPFHIVQAFSTQ